MLTQVYTNTAYWLVCARNDAERVKHGVAYATTMKEMKERDVRVFWPFRHHVFMALTCVSSSGIAPHAML
jgi:hypothetical protein